MGTVICKFGGSSLANAAQIEKITSIIHSDSRRRFIVVSAPGKRHPKDKKITDLLYLCYDLAEQDLAISEPFQRIRERFLEIGAQLKIKLNMEMLLDGVEEKIRTGASRDYVASRGEFLCGQLIAHHLGASFVDPADSIKILSNGRVDEMTYQLLEQSLSGSGLYVIPGFYGSTPEGEIRTFPRGGSDITGAIVARAVMGDVYENWTDVSGFLMADPAVVKDPKPMPRVTYREIRELAYMGANVFHEEAIFPVYGVNIPIHIRNTNAPEGPGTMIVDRRDIGGGVVVGIAGKRDFSLIFVEKLLMNRERGFGRRLFEILESQGISFEHAPSGIDTMSVIVRDDQLEGKRDFLKEELKKYLNLDRVDIMSGFALIATVGEGMAYRPGIAARLFAALAEAQVNVRIIDQGSSEINIIVGVEAKDYDRALNAIYQAFC